MSIIKFRVVVIKVCLLKRSLECSGLKLDKENIYSKKFRGKNSTDGSQNLNCAYIHKSLF